MTEPPRAPSVYICSSTVSAAAHIPLFQSVIAISYQITDDLGDLPAALVRLPLPVFAVNLWQVDQGMEQEVKFWQADPELGRGLSWP